MSCNLEIHDELKNVEVICPFCDQQLVKDKSVKLVEPCCSNQQIENNNRMSVYQLWFSLWLSNYI